MSVDTDSLNFQAKPQSSLKGASRKGLNTIPPKNVIVVNFAKYLQLILRRA